MKSRKMWYIGLAVIGVVLFVLSNKIDAEVGEGREKIDRAQHAVDQTNSLFSLNPISKEVGKGLTGSVQRKIDEGSREAQFYSLVAIIFYWGGIALILVGGGLFAYHTFSRKSGS